MRKGVSTYPLLIAPSFGEACNLTVQQLLYDVITLHNVVVTVDGGSPEIRDPDGLLSAINRPFTSAYGKLAYRNGLEQAAALMESLVRNHPFVDGNKRTGMLLTMYFLERCGYWRNVAYLSQHEVLGMEELTLQIAQGQLDRQRILLELRRILEPSRNRIVRSARLLTGVFMRLADIFGRSG